MSLRTLALAGNQLTGTIPDSINELEQLRSLWLQDNQLCGTIPAVGALDELRQMDLSNNMLGGDLPFDISGCHELQRFDVRPSTAPFLLCACYSNFLPAAVHIFA